MVEVQGRKFTVILRQEPEAVILLPKEIAV